MDLIIKKYFRYFKTKSKIDYAFTVEAKSANSDNKFSAFKKPRWDTNNFWDNEIDQPKSP